jgi:hypothetical protein
MCGWVCGAIAAVSGCFAHSNGQGPTVAILAVRCLVLCRQPDFLHMKTPVVTVTQVKKVAGGYYWWKLIVYLDS